MSLLSLCIAAVVLGQNPTRLPRASVIIFDTTASKPDGLNQGQSPVPSFLTSPDDGVVFDIDGDGIAETVAWTKANLEVAFLAIDRNGDGQITSGKELLGANTVADATNGFAALQTLNMELNGGTRKGLIDADEPLFAKLLLWTDRNHNGVSEPEELKPFGEQFSGIIPGWTPQDRRDANGNRFLSEGQVFVRTGRGRNYLMPRGEDRYSRARKVYGVSLAVQQ